MEELGVYTNSNGSEYKLVVNGTTIELQVWDHQAFEWATVDYWQGNVLCAKLTEELKEEELCQSNVPIVEAESYAI